jgi:hypothetical protein
LRDWDGPARAWGLGFLTLASLGLGVALAYVHLESGFAPAGLLSRFHGPETEAISQHTWRSLLQTTHTHLFTLTFLQCMLGAFTLMSSLPPRAKAWLAGGGFVPIILDHAAMWLLYLYGGAWSFGLMASGLFMTAVFVLEIGICARELLGRRKRLS